MKLLLTSAVGWKSVAVLELTAPRWATEIAGPAYAIDDDTAITVVDGVVEVVSEGTWKLLR